MKNNRKGEQGLVVVEAMIIMPIAILSVILLIYISLFFCQRANLQAALETSVIYYKNTITDTFISADDELAFTITEESVSDRRGNSYLADEPENPYRGMFTFMQSASSEEAFERFFGSVAGNLLLSDTVDVTYKMRNYVIFHELEATAVQHVQFPLINFSILGIENNNYTISASARVAVVDHEDLIRNADYAIDLLEETKLGDVMKDFAQNVVALYNRLKSFLGIG